jgi:hypothetical protein
LIDSTFRFVDISGIYEKGFTMTAGFITFSVLGEKFRALRLYLWNQKMSVTENSIRPNRHDTDIVLSLTLDLDLAYDRTIEMNFFSSFKYPKALDLLTQCRSESKTI